MERRTYGDVLATLDRDQKKAVAEMTQRIVNDVIDVIGDDILRRLVTDDFESPVNVHFEDVVPRVMNKLWDVEFGED